MRTVGISSKDMLHGPRPLPLLDVALRYAARTIEPKDGEGDGPVHDPVHDKAVPGGPARLLRPTTAAPSSSDSFLFSKTQAVSSRANKSGLSSIRAVSMVLVIVIYQLRHEQGLER